MYVGEDFFLSYGFTLFGPLCKLDSQFPPLYGSYFDLTGTGTLNVTSVFNPPKPATLSSGRYAVLVVANVFYAPTTVTLSIGPIPATTYPTISVISIAMTLTTTSTTLTAATLEAPFMQTYGDWIVAAIIAALAVALLFFNRRMKKPTK